MSAALIDGTVGYRTSGKAAALLALAVFVLLADGAYGGCCAIQPQTGEGGDGHCDLKSTPARCSAANGAYSAGTGSKDWACVIYETSGEAICQCNFGSACADPHITGFDGSNYMLWGKKDTTYNILSERSHQVNVRLFDDPKPSDGRPGHADHALFIDAVGVMINDARIIVRMVTAGTDDLEPELAGVVRSSASVAALKGTKVLAVSTIGPDGKKCHAVWTGKPVHQPIDSYTSYDITDPTHVEISSRELALTVLLRNNHHVDFQVNGIAVSWSNVHGVLGQTYAAAFSNSGPAVPVSGTVLSAAKPHVTGSKKQLRLEGTEDDYVTSDLLSADDKFSRFVVGSSTARVLSAATTADAGSSRKMLMMRGNAAGGVVVGSTTGPQDMVEMSWSVAAGVVGDP